MIHDQEHASIETHYILGVRRRLLLTQIDFASYCWVISSTFTDESHKERLVKVYDRSGEGIAGTDRPITNRSVHRTPCETRAHEERPKRARNVAKRRKVSNRPFQLVA